MEIFRNLSEKLQFIQFITSCPRNGLFGCLFIRKDIKIFQILFFVARFLNGENLFVFFFESKV